MSLLEYLNANHIDVRGGKINKIEPVIVQSKEIDGLVYGVPQILGQEIGQGTIYFDSGIYFPKSAHDFADIDYFITSGGREALSNRALGAEVFNDEMTVPEITAVCKPLSINQVKSIFEKKMSQNQKILDFLDKMSYSSK